MSSNGNKYYVSFVIILVSIFGYILSQKSDVFSIFLAFQKLVERQFNRKIVAIQIDWGGEFRSLHTYFTSQGIQHRLTCPHTFQQNGSVERRHCTVVEFGLSLLAHSSVPLNYWDHAFLMATYTFNRLPTSSLGTLMLFEKISDQLLDYSLFCVFGCTCYPFLWPFNLYKFDFRSKLCVFLGVSNLHKGFKCLDPQTERVFISHHVAFYETCFHFKRMCSSPSTPLSSHVVFPSSLTTPTSLPSATLSVLLRLLLLKITLPHLPCGYYLDLYLCSSSCCSVASPTLHAR